MKQLATILMTLAMAAASRAGEIGYLEDFALADDRSVLGIAHDQLESDDKFMRHLAQSVRNGLGDRAGTCIDPRMQVVEGKSVCLVSCQRSPEPVFLCWKSLEKSERGDFYVRSGPGTVRLGETDVEEYVRTRFPQKAAGSAGS